MMRSSSAGEYGLALFKLAKEMGAGSEIFNDFTAVKSCFEADSDFERLLGNPRLTQEERTQVLDNIFGGKINVYLLNMLKILASKRLLGIVDGCWLEYRRLYCQDNNILPVKVTSAQELSEGQKKKIEESLAEKTGSRILLSCAVDESLIGGLILEYGGKRYDATVRNRLTGLKKSIIQDY